MPRAALWLIASALAAGCDRREPPAPVGSPSVALPELAPPAPVRDLSGGPSTTSASGPTAPAPSSPPAAPSAPPDAIAVDPATLPQTRDRPKASGAAFDARVRALWDAIVADDPDRALVFFFPLGGYEQVKDVGDPATDWRRRLVAAYTHDIHTLHARLGADAPRATLTGLDVPEARGRWVDPGEEYNKIGYYRVFGSRLRFEVDGEARSFEVKSLISWRGDWYVVHLSAIR
jgi:hypothetical protein